MRIDFSLPEFAKDSSIYDLAIGNFDGVHLGHQVLLKHLTEKAKKQGQSSGVITFSNHPSTVLVPEKPVQLLCTVEHKVLLLRKMLIDHLFLLEFTPEVAEKSAEDFLKDLKGKVAFSDLFFGNEGHLGKGREGDKETVAALGKVLHFKTHYLPYFTVDGERISSSRIRECIRKGDFAQVDKLLGRPYSIYASVMHGSGRGTSIGFPTANIDVAQLCLPPNGVYAVFATYQGKEYPGVANLGFAPTIRDSTQPILEVHFFDQMIDLYDQFLDIRFHTFIRPEMRFPSIDDLKLQIARDVMTTRSLLTSQK